LTEFWPVISAFRAEKPPGRSRFFATCSAATHWPRFRNPAHVVFRSPPGAVTPLFASAFVSDVSNLSLFRTDIAE